MHWSFAQHSKIHGKKILLAFSLPSERMSFLDIAMLILKNFNFEARTKFLVVTWSFWFRCNKWVHEKELGHPSMAMEHGLAIIFQEIKRNSQDNPYMRGSWQHPQENSFKLNIDGALFADQ